MRRLVLVIGLLALIPLMTAGRPADFCQRHPSHPHCSPSTPSPSPSPTPAPTSTPTSGAVPRLLFGIGPEADSALRTRLYAEAPVNLLTSWYNGPNDLNWMPGWEDDLVPQAYARGEALHLIVWTDIPETTIATAYGTACGRPYPLSSRFLDDMRILAHTFRQRDSDDRLYVTLFTEFQTFACSDNAWNPNAQTNAYWRALKDRYMETLPIFRAVGGKVSLGWGGWQTRFDNTITGAGRSMFQYFADVMAASDFQSFQAMQSDSNVNDVRNMVATLDDFGPVMLAHYKPDSGNQATFSADIHTMLTDSFLASVPALFAWSFMDSVNLNASESDYVFARDAVRRYGG